MSLPSAPTGLKDDADKPRFPSFTYSGPKELDLPEEGTMEIRFRKKRETSSTREDGKHWYECTIEVKCICDVESEAEEAEEEAPTRRDRSAEEALDALAQALSEKRGNSEYE